MGPPSERRRVAPPRQPPISCSPRQWVRGSPVRLMGGSSGISPGQESARLRGVSRTWGGVLIRPMLRPAAERAHLVHPHPLHNGFENHEGLRRDYL